MGDDYPGLRFALPRAISFHPFGGLRAGSVGDGFSPLRLPFMYTSFACTSGLYGTSLALQVCMARKDA